MEAIPVNNQSPLTEEEKLVKKYATKTPEEFDNEQDALRGEVNVAAQALLQNIEKYSSKTDELKDSATGATLAIVKRPTNAQFRRFTPPQLAKYKDDPESVPYEVAVAYEEDVFKLMEELIVQPKKTAEEWKSTVGDEFVALFQAHMFKTRQKLSEDVKRFL